MAATYAAITPVRSESANLRRLAASLRGQTVQPLRWVIVDNGSTDDTPEAAAELAAELEWARVLEIPGEAAPRPGAPIVRAFHAGLRALDVVPDVVVKLDADVSLDPDYFAKQLAAFDDETLGISSGTCLELEHGEWTPKAAVAAGAARGAARAYRWECLQRILPLAESVGWDGLDQFKAETLGWRTEMLSDIGFYHHRPVGDRDGSPSARWRALGAGAWYMGYRPSYLLLRAVNRARRDPRALAMIPAYASAALRRQEQFADVDARRQLRRHQSVRGIARRALR